MIKDFLVLTFKSARHRPIRSWLTVVGIVIGVMLVVVIFALSSGVQNLLSKTLQMFGSDLILVFPGKETNPLAGIVGGQRFRESDIEDLENIRGVKFVAPFDVNMLNVEFKGEKKSVMVHGSPWDKLRPAFEESQGVKIENGRWPTEDGGPEIVIGYLVAHELFKEDVRVGDEIIIKSKRMRVAGILSRIGVQDDDNSLYVSLFMFHALTGKGPGVISALIKTEPGANLDIVSREIKTRLAEQEEVRDFSVLTPAKANQLVGNILGIVEFVLLVIALISLVVGAVGIMNTMYTSVLERTKHIGIMKAVGATSDAILSLFLIESGMIGLFGGVFGVLLGVLAAYGIGVLAGQFGISGLFSFESLDFFAFVVVLIITFITGIIAGVLPARAASRMQPADALRYE